ncbi:hypothetical protein ABPG77_006994 [Micractinium sp. CCAP 211/92]
MEVRVDVVVPRVTPGALQASYMPLNADPRLLPERSNAYLTGATSSAAAAAVPKLGAAVSRGYGRAPTAFVYTSADTLLSTTTYQSPAAAAAAANTGPSSRAAGSVQALAFCCGGSPARARDSGASIPGPPPCSRTLLYTRTIAGTEPNHQQQHSAPPAAPAVDLLDRLTLLRRLAPTTSPAPRPLRLAAAEQAFTAAPAPTASRKGPAAAGAASNPRSTNTIGSIRWAWDDSLLGHITARPITAAPAPGWRYCGDVVAAASVAAVALDAGAGITAASASCSISGSKGGAALEAGVAAAGCQADELAGQAQLALQGDEEILLVVRSPQPHHPHMEEDAAQPECSAEALTSRSTGGRTAFRPPGPLKHRFGNKPAPQPRPAPCPEERARAAGLRGCGCPRPARQPGRDVGSAWQGRCRASGDGSGWIRGSWASEDGQVAAVAVLASRPRSAAVEELRRSSSAAAAAAAPSRPSSACPGLVAQEGGRHGARRDAAVGTCTAMVGSPAGTTSVSVTAQGDVLVVASPRAGAIEPDAKQQEHVVVVATSPRSGGVGGSDVVLVCHEHAEPPRSTRRKPAKAATVAAGDQGGAAHTKLTVSVPANSGGSFRIRADARGSAAAGPAPGAPGGSGPPSHIKAWHPQPVPACPGHAAAAHAAAFPGGAAASATVGVAPGQPAPAPAVHQARMAELERLEGEMRRREKSFNDLLGELDRISAKCARLTAQTAVGGSVGCGRMGGAGPAGTRDGTSDGSSGRRPHQRSKGPQGHADCTDRRGRPSPLQQQRGTAQLFGSLDAALAGSGLPAAGIPEQAPGSNPSGRPSGFNQDDDADWGWNNLLAFEQQIRDQQRKLVEQGVLPAAYA